MAFKRTVLLGLVTFVAAGCGNKSAEDFQPAATSARDALTAALTAWSEGKPPVSDSETGPTVQFGDFEHSGGKQLRAFQIVGNEPKLDGSAQVFRVRLELAGEAAKEVDYYVVGLNPLWILRDHDYEQASMQ